MCFFTRSLCATVGVFHVFLLNRLFVYNGAWRWLRLFQNRVFKLSLEPTQHVRSGPELLNTMNITEDHPQEVWLDYLGLLRSNIYIYIYFFFLTSFPISLFFMCIYIYMCVFERPSRHVFRLENSGIEIYEAQASSRLSRPFVPFGWSLWLQWKVRPDVKI